uniref:Uncharacterized protein n=1 Tax=Lepeophtheirus salmonis TaxID=72036 RepID=A0A0K2U279_LEPSM
MLSVMNMLDSTLELMRPVMDTPPKESTLLPFLTVVSKPCPTTLLMLTLAMLLTLLTPERPNTNHTTLLLLLTSLLPSTTLLQLHTNLPLSTGLLPSTTLKHLSSIVLLFSNDK